MINKFGFLKHREMMEKGSSVPWTKVLEELTNGRSNSLDPVPMLEYFEPLRQWLLKQNLTLVDWDCDKYLDRKNKLVRSYEAVSMGLNSSSLSYDLNAKFVLFLLVVLKLTTGIAY